VRKLARDEVKNTNHLHNLWLVLKKRLRHQYPAVTHIFDSAGKVCYAPLIGQKINVGLGFQDETFYIPAATHFASITHKNALRILNFILSQSNRLLFTSINCSLYTTNRPRGVCSSKRHQVLRSLPLRMHFINRSNWIATLCSGAKQHLRSAISFLRTFNTPHLISCIYIYIYNRPFNAWKSLLVACLHGCAGTYALN